MNLAAVLELEAAYEHARQSLDKVAYANGYPQYPDAIKQFMFSLTAEPWRATQDFPDGVGSILAKIDQASFDEICFVLTRAGRSERFGDGVWIGILKRDQLRGAIERLKVLTD